MSDVINYGLLEGQRDTDWVAGVLPYEERNPSGDWTQFLPPGEWQKANQVDTMACVTFSALNCLETQMKFYGKEQNLSDRFTAKKSGTTPQGNYLYRVADSIRNDGVVSEFMWPAPQNFTWETYYAEPPPLAVQRPNVRYEFLPTPITRDALKYHLKHAPIQVCIPGHAVMLFASSGQVDRFFDSYSPFLKEWTSPFSSALKMVYYDSVTQTPMTKKEVQKMYKLAFYKLPDDKELAYWVGKTLDMFLDVAIDDRAKFLAAPLPQ